MSHIFYAYLPHHLANRTRARTNVTHGSFYACGPDTRVINIHTQTRRRRLISIERANRAALCDHNAHVITLARVSRAQTQLNINAFDRHARITHETTRSAQTDTARTRACVFEKVISKTHDRHKQYRTQRHLYTPHM